MIVNLLTFACVAVLWWVVAWFGLPLDIRHLSVPSLLALLFVVPVVLQTMIVFFRRWRAKIRIQREQAAVAQVEAEKLQRIDAARQEHQRKLDERRVRMDCCGAWVNAVVHQPPRQIPDGVQWVCAKDVVDGVWPNALQEPVQSLLSDVFQQTPAAAWLPLYVVPNARRDGIEQMELVRGAWQQAIVDAGLPLPPAQSDCKFLPGSGSVADRLLAVMNNDPNLPACLLLGVDSLLDEWPGGWQSGNDLDADTRARWARQGRPGQAVALVMVRRPGLKINTPPAIKTGTAQTEVNSPYWDRQYEDESAQLAWGRVPRELHENLLANKLLASFAAGGNFFDEGGLGKGNALTRKIQGALEVALVNANLRDLPFEPNADGESEPLETEWLVHNSGTLSQGGAYLASLTRALNYFGCELNPIDEGDNLVSLFDNIGTARSTVALAVSALRADATGLSVVNADFETDKSFSVNVLISVKG